VHTLCARTLRAVWIRTKPRQCYVLDQNTADNWIRIEFGIKNSKNRESSEEQHEGVFRRTIGKFRERVFLFDAPSDGYSLAYIHAHPTDLTRTTRRQLSSIQLQRPIGHKK
jgi:hypothetical protein